MSGALAWLSFFATLVIIVVWPWGISRAFKATRERRGFAKFFWRVIVLALPIGGFVLFAAANAIRSRNSPETVKLGTVLVAFHLAALLGGFWGHALMRQAAVLHVHVDQRVVADHRQEWWFASSRDGRPRLCLAMSGGGIRSASVNIGVLWALHELGLLDRVDVMSAVSGGSYAMSWYLLQQYYGHQIEKWEGEPYRMELFDPQGRFQRHLAERARQFGADDSISYYVMAGSAVLNDVMGWNFVRAMTWMRGDENSVNEGAAGRFDYRYSLQRTFQQFKSRASDDEILNPGRPVPLWEEFTARRFSIVREVTFTQLAEFAQAKKLPFFIFNTTVDVAHDGAEASPAWHAVFELNAWGLGSDSYGYSPWTDIENRGDRFAAIRLVNVAPAISGAALSPAHLQEDAAMTLFNVDLGYLIPRFKGGDQGSLYLSDGGHSENLGIYSLVRRGCHNIIVVDGEEEVASSYAFISYKRVRDLLWNEMGLRFRVPAIEDGAFQFLAPVMRGNIAGNGLPGKDDGQSATHVFYLKLAMDKTRPQDYPENLRDQRLGKAFPQDPTVNQNFSDVQFAAYRDLGYWIAKRSPELKDLAATLASSR